jgi:hypothetical protein
MLAQAAAREGRSQDGGAQGRGVQGRLGEAGPRRPSRRPRSRRPRPRRSVPRPVSGARPRSPTTGCSERCSAARASPRPTLLRSRKTPPLPPRHPADKDPARSRRLAAERGPARPRRFAERSGTQLHRRPRPRPNAARTRPRSCPAPSRCSRPAAPDSRGSTRPRAARRRPQPERPSRVLSWLGATRRRMQRGVVRDHRFGFGSALVLALLTGAGAVRAAEAGARLAGADWGGIVAGRGSSSPFRSPPPPPVAP